MRKLAAQPVTVASIAVPTSAIDGRQPLHVKGYIQPMQQHAGKQIGEDHPYQPRKQPQHDELHAEDGGDVVSLARPGF